MQHITWSMNSRARVSESDEVWGRWLPFRKFGLMNTHPSAAALNIPPGRIRDVLLRGAENTGLGAVTRMYFAVDSEATLQHLEYCFGNAFTRKAVPERRRKQFNVLTLWNVAAFTRRAEDLITILHETLSLPRFDHLDLITVLDWTTLTAERNLGSVNDRRSLTPGIQMVRARTTRTRPRVGSLALQSLITDMARVIDSHPAYRDASVIIGGPDSLGDSPNLRTRMAHGVASATGKEFISLRWPAWQLANDAPPLSSLDRRITGSCIVIDDEWTDGTPMNALARLARASGASHVFGIAATMSHISEIQD